MHVDSLKTKALYCLIIMATIVVQSCEKHENGAVYIHTKDTIVYKVPFPGPGQLESWCIDYDFSEIEVDQISELRIDLLDSGRIQKSIIYPKSSIDTLVRKDGRNLKNLHIIFHENQKLSTNQVKASFVVNKARSSIIQSLDIYLEMYELKNKYSFPLKGNSLISAGYFNSGGHLSRSTLYSIDVVGLDDMYSPVNRIDESNDATISWGKDILSPADGVVVFEEKNIKDQQYGHYDQETFRKEDNSYAYWGNCVVIDFGQEEYGVFMHMRKGSVSVNKRDTVKKGQKLGEIGNSGDSYGPHLHYHLQNGPIPLRSQGLPLEFEDVNIQFLRKGEIISLPKLQ